MRFILGLLLSAVATAQPIPVPLQPFLNGELTLDRALGIAVAGRPELEAASFAVEARAGAIQQAARAPNPTFSIQTENWRFSDRFSASRDLDLFLSASQRIETSGKRGRRRAMAETEREAAQAEGAVLRWRIRAAVAEAWTHALGAQRKVELLEGTLETAEELLGFQRARVREGAAGEIEALKASVEVEKIRGSLGSAGIEADQAKLRLLREMGVASARTFVLRAEAPQPPAASDRTELSKQAIAGRPDLALHRRLLERSRANVELQRAQAKPDVTPYVGYKRTETFDTLIGGISIPLPVRNRNQGAIAESLAEVKRLEALVRASEMRVRSEVEAASIAVARRWSLMESLRSGGLEQARQTHQIALSAYREQAADLLFVLDAQRTLSDVEQLRAEAENQYRLARVQLHAALGARLPRLASESHPEGEVQ